MSESTAVEVAKAAEFVAVAPVAPEPTSLALEIVRMASNSAIDVQKLAALIDLQERVEKRDAEAAFNRAFAAMQSKIPVILERGKADRGDRGGSYSYARLEVVMEVLRPILHDHGFGLSHETEYLDNGQRVKVTGILTHQDGHAKRSTFLASADSGGGKSSVQAMGSSTSYGRRYTTYDLLGIATRAQDDDGGKADQTEAPAKFEDWLADLDAAADDGWAALEKAWQASAEDLKKFANRHRSKEWNAIKVKAQKADAKKAGANRGA